MNGADITCTVESNYIWSSKLVNSNQVNSALTYYLHFGSVVDQRLRVTSTLLVKILTEPAFNVLRTQEQLGYVVMCSPWTLPGGSERGFRIVIQSGKLPGYLEYRVEAFLDRMKDAIDQMSDNAFQEYKTGLEKKWLEADKNLAEEANRFMVDISNGQLDFLGSTSFTFITHFSDLTDGRRERCPFTKGHHQGRCSFSLPFTCSPLFHHQSQTIDPHALAKAAEENKY